MNVIRFVVNLSPFTRCYPLTRLMAVQYRYNSLIDGTGPPMYKYVIPYTTYHLNTSHIYHFFFFCYIYILHIDIYISFFFSVTWRDSFVQFMHIFVTVSLLRFIVPFLKILSNQPPELPLAFTLAKQIQRVWPSLELSRYRRKKVE